MSFDGLIVTAIAAVVVIGLFIWMRKKPALSVSPDENPTNRNKPSDE
jgi:hypothetical protein